MQTKTIQKHFQAGLTLIELLIALAISAILLVGAFYGYQAVWGAKGQNDGQLLAQAAQCARNIYSNAPDFTGISASNLAASSCFPAGNVSGTSPNFTVKDSNGYVLTAAPATLTTTNDAVSFTLSAIPKDLCSQILPALAPAASQMTAGPAGNGSATTVVAYGGSFQPGAIGVACSGGTNDIIFTVTK